MNTINLDNTDPFDFENKSFHVLGNLDQNNLTLEQTEKLRFKFRNKKSFDFKVDDIWATIGWADDQKKEKLSGRIEFSRNGNEESGSPTLQIIKEIYEINPELDAKEHKVTERFIDFSKVKFRWDKTFTLEDIPNLRLTLYVEKNEGALMCYQHGSDNDFNDPKSEFEFIQPQKTDDNYSSERDRLNFIFPILPDEELEENEKDGKSVFNLTGEKRKTGFLLKIFTYKRKVADADELFNQAVENINARADRTNLAYEIIGKDKYGICNYDPANHNFVDYRALPIDFNKKTLLLIHGTFMNVWITFAELMEAEEGGVCLLNKLIDDKKFEQIIAFNYPTISHDAKQNAEIFYQLIGGKKQFSQPVSIIGSSRGCLLAKYFTADPDNKIFTADKVIMFSAANGVGYFTFGGHISKFLSVMRKISGPGAKIVLALLQFSAEYFLKLPGSQLMTPGNKSLDDLLKMETNNPDTEYFNVVSDWNVSLANESHKKIFGAGLDLLIRAILGRENDWVVGCVEQGKYYHTTSNNKDPKRIISMHARYFDKEYTKENTHAIIYDYFPVIQEV